VYNSGQCGFCPHVSLIRFSCLLLIELTQSELLSVVKEIGVTPSSPLQSCHSSVSDHLRSVVTSSAASFSNTSSVTSNMLRDISNIYNLHDNGTNDDDKEEHDYNKKQEKDDDVEHYKETYSITVGPITWGKTKLGGNMLFMEESIYVFQSKSDKLNKTLWRCQRRDKKCRAVVYTDSTSACYRGNNGIDHNHPTDLLLAKKYRLVNDLKRKVEDLTVNVPAAVDHGIANLGLDNEDMVNFPLPTTVGKFFLQVKLGIYSLSRREESWKHKLFACLCVRTSLIGSKMM
jgi:hypothetical protein